MLFVPVPIGSTSGSGITQYVQSLTFSGTYATASYYTAADGGIFYCPDGRIGIVVHGGVNSSYENMRFNLSSAPAGVTLSGQSVWGFSSASANGVANCYYIGIINGVTANINIAIAMNTVDGTSDYIQCDITITNA